MGKILGIAIQNYGSLKNIKMGKLYSDQSGSELGNMAAIIGPSGNGKSTLADAFGFISDCLSTDVESACDANNRGGYDQLISQGSSDPIHFELYYKENSNSRPITYELTIAKDRYDRPYVKDLKHRDVPAFDLVRASVNVVVPAIIISMGTNSTLPLSTTYTTFMVAMGTSLADRAWGLESAVYRVSGTVRVILGWFATALIAFLSAASLALLLKVIGVKAIIPIIIVAGMTVVAVYEKDGKVSAERTIAVDDPELAVSGYDSVVAGEKTVTVSYRGVSATFTVTVKAAPVEPGPEPQPNPDGTTEPSTPEAAGEGSTVANTGASVFGVMIAAVALAAVGIGLVALRVRRRG